METQSLVNSMFRYIGQTVTVFTTSGGLSGSGFTGVLLAIDCNNIKLLCDIGAAPSCPLGSSCGGFRNNSCSNGFNNFNSSGYNNYNNNYSWYGRNPLGSITIIPTRSIACFTHNAI